MIISKHEYILNILSEELSKSEENLGKYGIKNMILNAPKNFINYGFMFKKDEKRNKYNKGWLFIFSFGCLIKCGNRDDKKYLDEKNQKE